MSIPRNLGNFADNVNANGKVEVTGINATGTPSSTTALFGNGTWQSVSVTPAAVSDQANTSTGYFSLPTGTTAQRPASPTNGMTRFNTTLGYIEWYSSTLGTWLGISEPPNYSIDVLLVAGGGGGGGSTAGGGGAGGAIDGSYSVAPSTPYSIVIGAGAASSAYQSTGYNGNDSTGFAYTAIGGGRGAGTSSSTTFSGSTGGSGGGGGGYASGGGIPNSGNGYAGTAGQGYAGGNYFSDNFPGGGGGGAGSVGANATSSAGGNGGIGINWKSLGTYYAGGGGGGSGSAISYGGAGGGGNGASGTGAQSGTVNTGGGGGGGFSYGGGGGGGGGSGICIIRYIGTPKGSGGSITQAGGYTYHTFTTSGTFIA